MKDTVISGLPVYDNVEEEGVEMPFVQPDTSSTQHEEQLKEPDHQIPVRFEIHISILDMWKCQNLKLFKSALVWFILKIKNFAVIGC